MYCVNKRENRKGREERESERWKKSGPPGMSEQLGAGGMTGVIWTELGGCHYGDWFLMSLLMYFQHQLFPLLGLGTCEPCRSRWGCWQGLRDLGVWWGSLGKMVQGILQRMSLAWDRGLDVFASTQICQVLGGLGASSFSLSGWLSLLPHC